MSEAAKFEYWCDEYCVFLEGMYDALVHSLQAFGITTKRPIGYADFCLHVYEQSKPL